MPLKISNAGDGGCEHPADDFDGLSALRDAARPGGRRRIFHGGISRQRTRVGRDLTLAIARNAMFVPPLLPSPPSPVPFVSLIIWENYSRAHYESRQRDNHAGNYERNNNSPA